MKERPILFSSLMVRALLNCTKSQTRRVAIKTSQPRAVYITDFDATECSIEIENKHSGDRYWKSCPYGQPGDRLWVREAFAIVPRTAYRCSEGVQQTLRPDDDHDAAIYREGWARSRSGFRWRPSIHMPRWASRLLLEITSVSIERLNNISEADAKAEGLHYDDEIPFNGPWFIGACEPDGFANPVDAYRELWESINGTGSWEENPWVWVVQFKRVQP
nr:hypothetical protein [Dechloromonas sp.]